MEINKVANQTTYDSYSEFFEDAIYKRNLFQRIKMQDFIYRGECSDKFKLIPSVLRSDYEKAKNYLFHTVIKGKPILDKYQPENFPSGSEFLQIEGEYQLLSNFYSIANNQGLWLPEGLQKIYTDVTHCEWFYENNTWYSDEMAQLAALAQHYGIPTRMLDWSKDLLIALYFACHEACIKLLRGKIDNSDYMVIQLLNTSILNLSQASGKSYPIKFVVPKYCDNPNLNAQQGILTYWNLQFDNTSVFNLNVPVDRTPLDKKLLSYRKYKLPFPLIYKLRIPINECAKAFIHINQLGNNSARFFPGYAGVIKQIDDEIMIRTIFERFP